MNELKFFARMKEVPRTTDQQKRFSPKSKTFYRTPKQLEAQGMLVRALSGHQPKEAFVRAIKMTVIWRFNYKGGHKDGELKTTRPDLDNLQKMLQDVMCRMGFYKDDSLIVDLHVKKIWHNDSGLEIEIEEINNN